jgi:hypothetical protein
MVVVTAAAGQLSCPAMGSQLVVWKLLLAVGWFEAGQVGSQCGGVGRGRVGSFQLAVASFLNRMRTA